MIIELEKMFLKSEELLDFKKRVFKLKIILHQICYYYIRISFSNKEKILLPFKLKIFINNQASCLNAYVFNLETEQLVIFYSNLTLIHIISTFYL